MSFFYYLPGATVGMTDRETIRQAGLDTALRDCLETQLAFQERLIVHQVHANGPDPQKRSGVMLIPQPSGGREIPGKVGYYPDEQEWIAAGGYWLGWVRERPPTPELLAREPLIAGYDALLGDGQTWHCPTIRKSGIAPNLPRGMGLDAAGEFAMRVLPAFDWAWQLSAEIFDKVFGAPSLAFSEAYRLSVLCLSLNYRVGPREVSQLGLITTENFQRIFEAAVDWPVVQELLNEGAGDEQKKKHGISARACESFAWLAGRWPEHRPSRGDLYLMSRGVGKEDPVALVGVPVKR